MFFSCSVCTEVLTSNCEITSTYCGHVFHTNCITKWIAQKQNCPQCRTRCTDNGIHRIYLSESPKENLIPDLLQMAAENGHLQVYERIIAKEEDKNPKDYSGFTHLHLAAENGHANICKSIIDSVDDKNPKDNEGLTPLHIATQEGNEQVCKLIMLAVYD